MSGHDGLPRTDAVRHPSRYLLHPLRPVARWVLRRWWVITLHHTDRVPRGEPVIYAANHVGVIDGPLLAIYSPHPVHALTKEEMFDGRMRRIMHAIGQIRLDRFQVDPAAVKQSVRVLRDGGAVGIFPEGARGAGDLQRFHRGAAYLAMVTGAPIVPVIFVGTRDPGGHSNSLPARGSRMDVWYGEPLRLAVRPWPRTKAAVGAASLRLRERMLEELAEALHTTGRELPGPLPAGEHEPDPGGGVTEKSA